MSVFGYKGEREREGSSQSANGSGVLDNGVGDVIL